jgi:hypothetical protein
MKSHPSSNPSLLKTSAWALLLATGLLSLNAQAQSQGARPLHNVDVQGTTDTAGAFTGRINITNVSQNASGQLVADGVLTGTLADGRRVRQEFSDAPVALSESDGSAVVAQQQGPNEPGVCDILFLDLGPIFLDLLGLTVDLAPIVLDIDAVPGAGRLLGNLLCAITGLLDPGGLGGLTEPLLTQVRNILQSLLDAINLLI